MGNQCVSQKKQVKINPKNNKYNGKFAQKIYVLRKNIKQPQLLELSSQTIQKLTRTGQYHDKYLLKLKDNYLLHQEHQLKDHISDINIMYQKKIQQIQQYLKILEISYIVSVQFQLKGIDIQNQACSISLCNFQKKYPLNQLKNNNDDDIYCLPCSHLFQRSCVVQLIKQHKQWIKCPVCQKIYGKMKGDQPQGEMIVLFDQNLTCQGFDRGTHIIKYIFQSGIRDGKIYPSTVRVAYLPNSEQGKQILNLLREAFDRKLTFTIGRSVTTGLDHQVIWNGIHHKTNINGGISRFGYPDETYFRRVKQQLAQKGIN